MQRIASSAASHFSIEKMAPCPLALALVATTTLALTSASAAPAAAALRQVGSPPASWTDAFPWTRVPTMAWTGMWGPFIRKNMTGTGRLDDKVVRFLAENNELIVASGLEPKSTATCLEPKVKDLANRVHAFNPNARVIV